MTDRFSGDLIYLGRRKAACEHLVDRYHHAESADAIRNEIRPVFGRYDPFAETSIKKTRYCTGDLTARLLAWDDLDELHVSRRIEKVDADKMLFEIVRKRLSDRLDRYSASVRGDDRP